MVFSWESGFVARWERGNISYTAGLIQSENVRRSAGPQNSDSALTEQRPPVTLGALRSLLQNVPQEEAEDGVEPTTKARRHRVI